MNDNAVITNFYIAAGERGDGRPVLSEVTLPQTMPVMLAPPSFSIRRRAEAEGIEAAAVVIVRRERLVGFGVTPKAGDRLKLRREGFNGPSSELEVFEIASLVDAVPGRVVGRAQPVTLILKEARDGVPA